MSSPRTAPADSCSLLNAEPLPGTAAHEHVWVCLEHPGNWGQDILDGTTFGEELSAALAQKIKDAHARLLLIRAPGRAGQIAKDSARQVFVGVTTPGKEGLYSLRVASPQALLELPLDTPEQLLEHGATLEDSPIALICAHSKRDRCCAIFGRPIAADLATKHDPGKIWECSHTGGHRFAPVMIFLPTGYTYGRITSSSAQVAYQALTQGQPPLLTGLRGRSCYEAPEQVAELTVRNLLAAEGETVSLKDLHVSRETQKNNSDRLLLSLEQEGESTFSTVTHADGRRWIVQTQADILPEVYASCGKAPKAGKSVRVLDVSQEASGSPRG